MNFFEFTHIPHPYIEGALSQTQTYRKLKQHTLKGFEKTIDTISRGKNV